MARKGFRQAGSASGGGGGMARKGFRQAGSASRRRRRQWSKTPRTQQTRGCEYVTGNGRCEYVTGNGRSVGQRPGTRVDSGSCGPQATWCEYVTGILTGHAGWHSAPSGQAGTYPLVGG
eukprot:6188397-Prymnesium_polylepis.1